MEARPLTAAGATLALVTACSSCRPEGRSESSYAPSSDSSTDNAEEPCPDTAWLEELPIVDCPGPIEGATLIETNSFNASIFYYSGVIDPTGFYLQLDGFSVVRPTQDLNTCGDYTTEIVDGELVGEYVYDLYFSIPLADEPIDYQGVYPYDEDAESWSDEPALQLVIGWYDASAGYQYVRTFMASDAGICLSRVRPGRLTGAFWWTPEERYADAYDPLYITFDLSDVSYDERICFGATYDSGLTEEEIWPELDCPDQTPTP